MNLDAGIVPPELVRIDENSLVADILRALQKGFRVFVFHVVFKFPVVFGRNAVPELWRAIVVVIDTGQIHILGVPAEHRAEASDVKVGTCDARQVNFSKSIAD